jgi:tRNA (adenine57-N1/adenine58-N1)-methyltransferase catalytic subunit
MEQTAPEQAAMEAIPSQHTPELQSATATAPESESASAVASATATATAAATATELPRAPQDAAATSEPASLERKPEPATPVAAPAGPYALAFAAGDPVTIIDSKTRRSLVFLLPGGRVDVSQGAVRSDDLIGALPGVRVRTTAGQIVAAYRTTLEEYVLLMPRAATVIPPKDIAFLVHWADVHPGATVVEAGVGSGALTLGLMRAVGPRGRVLSYEVRTDHANRARKNIEAWPDTRGVPFEIRLGDIHQELAALRDIDRIFLDLPDPQNTLAGATAALKPGGFIAAYLPGIRQIDAFVLAAMATRDVAEPEIVEVMARPWVVDSQRLRPDLRIVGHTGFLARLRRRGPALSVALPAAQAGEIAGVAPTLTAGPSLSAPEARDATDMADTGEGTAGNDPR